MSIETLIEFQKRIADMKNPRNRRAFLDSFYAELRQSNLSEAQVQEVGRASELLKQYGFEPHSRKLMIRAGTAFLASMDLGRLGDEDMYAALPYVNHIADQMESVGLVQPADDLIDYFTLQVVLMTPEQSKPSTLPLSESMTQAKKIAAHFPEGYREKSRFVVLPKDGPEIPGEFELEGKMVYPGYTRDGIMEIKTKIQNDPQGPISFGDAPEGVPSTVTYQRLRERPLRGIMLINYSMPSRQ